MKTSTVKEGVGIKMFWYQSVINLLRLFVQVCEKALVTGIYSHELIIDICDIKIP